MMCGKGEVSDIEELEKILSEKVEKDEEWEILEIGEVTPVYIGDLKSNLEKIPPPIVILAILATYSKKFHEKINITKLSKIAFEVEKKVLEPILLHPYLGFRSDNYGPFTKAIYDNLGFLQNLDLIDVSKDNAKTEIRLTERGLEMFQKEIQKVLPRKILRMIELIVKEYGSLNHDELLRRVYREYPEYTENSLVRDRYLY